MTAPNFANHSPSVIGKDSTLPEPVVVAPVGVSVKETGKGIRTGHIHDPILCGEQLARLALASKDPPFDSDPLHFKFGIEALHLSSHRSTNRTSRSRLRRCIRPRISLRVVNDYFPKSPRIHFLLADHPGVGKALIAGLLLEKLKNVTANAEVAHDRQ